MADQAEIHPTTRSRIESKQQLLEGYRGLSEGLASQLEIELRLLACSALTPDISINKRPG